jgi:hypothetical protein
MNTNRGTRAVSPVPIFFISRTYWLMLVRTYRVPSRWVRRSRMMRLSATAKLEVERVRGHPARLDRVEELDRDGQAAADEGVGQEHGPDGLLRTLLRRRVTRVRRPAFFPDSFRVLRQRQRNVNVRRVVRERERDRGRRLPGRRRRRRGFLDHARAEEVRSEAVGLAFAIEVRLARPRREAVLRFRRDGSPLRRRR